MVNYHGTTQKWPETNPGKYKTKITTMVLKNDFNHSGKVVVPLGWGGPLIINPIYTLYHVGYLLRAPIGDPTGRGGWFTAGRSLPKLIIICQLLESDASPIGSMFGIYTYIWLIFMVNVGEYTIHGSYGSWLWMACDALCIERSFCYQPLNQCTIFRGNPSNLPYSCIVYIVWFPPKWVPLNDLCAYVLYIQIIHQLFVAGFPKKKNILTSRCCKLARL